MIDDSKSTTSGVPNNFRFDNGFELEEGGESTREKNQIVYNNFLKWCNWSGNVFKYALLPGRIEFRVDHENSKQSFSRVYLNINQTTVRMYLHHIEFIREFILEVSRRKVHHGEKHTYPFIHSEQKPPDVLDVIAGSLDNAYRRYIEYHVSRNAIEFRLTRDIADAAIATYLVNCIREHNEIVYDSDSD